MNVLSLCRLRGLWVGFLGFCLAGASATGSTTASSSTSSSANSPPPASPLPVSLPYRVGFESSGGYSVGALSSDTSWEWDDGLSVKILSSGGVGSQSLSFRGWNRWLWLDTAGLGAGQTTWVDFYLRPVFAEVSDLPVGFESEQSAVTGFVKVDASRGEVYAIDGDGSGGGRWLASGKRAALTGNRSQAWLRLSYRLDYTGKRWDLFVNGKLALWDLGFVDDSLGRLSEFALRGDGLDATGLDAFYAGATNPLFVDTSGDGLPDTWLRAQGLSIASSQRYGDGDLDGLINVLEYQLSTRANLADTDGDGVNDGAEYAAGLSPTVADSYVLEALPFTENFESLTAGALPASGRWTAKGKAAVQRENVSGGTQALSLGADAVVDTFLAGSGQNVVWVDLDLEPRLRSAAPRLATDAACGFYFNAEGRAMARNGSGAGFWKLLDVAASEDWRRVTAKLNYTAQSYDLYIDGGRVARGFGFAHAQPFFSRLALEGSVAEFVDDVGVSTSEPAGLDDDRDGLANSKEVTLRTNRGAFRYGRRRAGRFPRKGSGHSIPWSSDTALWLRR